MRSKKAKDIVLGKASLSDDDVNFSKGKLRVSTYIDADVVMELKKMAVEENTKY